MILVQPPSIRVLEDIPVSIVPHFPPPGFQPLYLAFGEYRISGAPRDSEIRRASFIPFLRCPKVSGFSMVDLIPSSIGLFRELAIAESMSPPWLWMRYVISSVASAMDPSLSSSPKSSSSSVASFGKGAPLLCNFRSLKTRHPSLLLMLGQIYGLLKEECGKKVTSRRVRYSHCTKHFRTLSPMCSKRPVQNAEVSESEASW